MSQIEDLQPSEVHFWFCSLAGVTVESRARYRDMLDEFEQNRCLRFISDDARAQFLVGRALLRTCLSRYAPVDPPDWRFEFNAYGKPRLAPSHECDWLSFNLSHTRGMVVCGVCRDGQIGVDVETRRQHCELSLADRFFTPNEARAVFAAPDTARQTAFLTIWTLKEAIIKAQGQGLSCPLSAFEVHVDADEPQVSFTAGWCDDPQRWQLFRFPLESDFQAAIAVRREAGSKLQLQQRLAMPGAIP